jgi:hypothetical protein
MRPYTPPLIHQAATAAATPGWRVAVSSDTREPPDPPAITAGVMSSWESRPASVSACMVDSDEPVKHTSDSPVLGRSQMSTRLPAAARASASSRTPGESLGKRPPGVIAHGRPSPMIS